VKQEMPDCVRAAFIVGEVVYRFFTPWHIRMWHKIRGYRYINKEVTR